jgi:hypothetical protein
VRPKSLIVHNETYCPRFAVVEKSVIVGTSFKYTVRISNDDRNGSVAAFLRTTEITCCLETCDFDGFVVADEIVCAEVHTPLSYFSNRTRALVMYVYVTFNGVKLNFDEETEYYYTIYDRKCATADRDEGCATCLWNDRDGGIEYAHYLKWCPVNNRCTGSYQLYDKREVRNHEKCRTTADEVRVECAELGIRSFWPLYAPRMGGTVLSIVVRNHRMLAEGKTVGVTVAGRECANPVAAVDNETIACTVVRSESKLQQLVGPVRVTYVSSTARFTFTSAESMVFVDPVMTAVHPVCGSPSGGTLLTVTGRFLDAGADVHVSVVVGDGEHENAVACETVTRGSNAITCRTGAIRLPVARGRVRVEFDGSLREYAGPEAAVAFTYVTNDPAVDAGQAIEGIVSGGTAVPMHGRHLTCLERATLYVIDRHGDRRYAAGRCRVLNDSLMVCRAPRLDSVLYTGETSTDLRYGVMARDFGSRAFDLLHHGPVAVDFVLHADPVYTGFETDDTFGTLIIYGDSGRGYRVEDVNVTFRNSSGTVCTVTEVVPGRIICALTLPTADFGDVHGIVVTVGDRFVTDVANKFILRHSVTDSLKTLTASCGFFIAVLVVATLLITSAVLFRSKTKKQYTLK